jgi:hypothetical protein
MKLTSFTPIRMATVKIPKMSSNRVCHELLVGVEIYVIILENYLMLSFRAKCMHSL